jgi:MFS family permease
VSLPTANLRSLTTRRWKFRLLGLSVIPIVIATPFVWLLGGWVADRVANVIARRRGGHREPESHLITLAIPLMLGVLGTVLFGYAGQRGKEIHWMVSFFSIFLVSLSGLAANTIMAVFAVESYPQIPGYVCVRVLNPY